MSMLPRFNHRARPRQAPVTPTKTRVLVRTALCACGHRQGDHSAISGTCVGYRLMRTYTFASTPCPCPGFDKIEDA